MQVLDYVADGESREGYRRLSYSDLYFWMVILLTSQETPIIAYLSKGGRTKEVEADMDKKV